MSLSKGNRRCLVQGIWRRLFPVGAFVLLFMLSQDTYFVFHMHKKEIPRWYDNIWEGISPKLFLVQKAVHLQPSASFSWFGLKGMQKEEGIINNKLSADVWFFFFFSRWKQTLSNYILWPRNLDQDIERAHRVICQDTHRPNTWGCVRCVCVCSLLPPIMPSKINIQSTLKQFVRAST